MRQLRLCFALTAFASLTLSGLASGQSAADADMPTVRISQADAEKLVSEPDKLAQALSVDPSRSFYKASVGMIGGPMWEPAATFWTRPVPAITGSKPLLIPFCASFTVTVSLWAWKDRAADTGETVYGLAQGYPDQADGDRCSAPTDPQHFFRAENVEIASGAVEAFLKLTTLPPAERKRRVRVSCMEEPLQAPLCGLSTESVGDFSRIERTDCTETSYSVRKGKTVEKVVRQGGLKAKTCYRITEGTIYFRRTILIEIGPARPKAYVEESRGLI